MLRGRLGFNRLKTWIIPGVADEDFSVNVQFLFPCFLCPWFKINDCVHMALPVCHSWGWDSQSRVLLVGFRCSTLWLVCPCSPSSKKGAGTGLLLLFHFFPPTLLLL